MKYLIYGNEQDAMNRSEEIAINQGCNNNITKYWFGWVISYTSPPSTALIIPDDQTNFLDSSEQSLLQTESQLEVMGWFPSPPIP